MSPIQATEMAEHPLVLFEMARAFLRAAGRDRVMILLREELGFDPLESLLIVERMEALMEVAP